MEDCKRERRLSDPLDPPREETMKWAYDVLGHHLKTMRELNRKSKLPIEVTEEHIKIINRFMEEKKTKKMTKAEAFEWLKGKKVLCYSSKMEMVQGFVKSLGFHWSDYSEEPMLVSILFLGEDGKLTYSVSLKRFEEHESPEISADDILSIEIVEECAKDDEDPYFGGRIKDLQEMLEDDEVLIITKTNFLTMTK